MVDIRPATMTELDAVVDLWDRAGGPTRHRGRRAEAEALLRRDPHALLVAVHGGRVMGSIIVGWDGWRCHLYRLAVDAAARRRGVATALVDAAARHAASLGAPRVDAMVDRENPAAHAFWAQAGFEVQGHDDRWSRTGPL
jgi:ribosomal protein S18 acetylase RimI-like enzyme